MNEAPAQVIFGLRPCDARGFVQMDQVFGGYGGFYFDPLYNARREATTLLAVTCAEPAVHLLLHGHRRLPVGPRGRRRALHPGRGRLPGGALHREGRGGAGGATGAALTDATDAQTAAGQRGQAAAAAAKVDVPFDLDGVRDNLHDNIADARWADLAMRCISCGTCTYVCPNCYCFTINDSIVETKGERYRCWDNCFNPLYTEETSGHNPRAQEGQPVPQPLQPQVLVLPGQVRQPALLRLRPLHRALPDAHRHPRGDAGDGARRRRRR